MKKVLVICAFGAFVVICGAINLVLGVFVALIGYPALSGYLDDSQ